MKSLLQRILKAKSSNTILYSINGICIEAENILKSYEKNILKEVDKMCIESLSPETFEKWEDVKAGLKLSRKRMTTRIVAVPLAPQSEQEQGKKERCEYELVVEKYFGLSDQTPSGYLVRGVTFNLLVDFALAVHQHFAAPAADTVNKTENEE